MRRQPQSVMMQPPSETATVIRNFVTVLNNTQHVVQNTNLVMTYVQGRNNVQFHQLDTFNYIERYAVAKLMILVTAVFDCDAAANHILACYEKHAADNFVSLALMQMDDRQNLANDIYAAANVLEAQLGALEYAARVLYNQPMCGSAQTVLRVDLPPSMNNSVEVLKEILKNRLDRVAVVCGTYIGIYLGILTPRENTQMLSGMSG